MTNKNNDPIKIRQFTPAQLKLFNSNDEFLGLVNNEVEALRVRLDIAEKQYVGYYFMYGSVRIEINADGSVQTWPKDLYRDTLELCIKIRSIQIDRTGR